VALVAGVDGCPGGWLCVTRDDASGVIASALYPTATALVTQDPCPKLLAIDIPIGLTDAGRRRCDEEARRLLGGVRRNSVFPAPIRPALAAVSRADASRITQQADGRRVSAQAWAIVPKIRDLDAVLSAGLTDQARVREVHPEVCFWAWAGNKAMAHRKKSPAGRAERRRLINTHFGAQAVAQVRQCYLVRDVGHDDIHDAFAALWTAERILSRTAAAVPNPPPTDANGLRMEMWY